NRAERRDPHRGWRLRKGDHAQARGDLFTQRRFLAESLMGQVVQGAYAESTLFRRVRLLLSGSDVGGDPLPHRCHGISTVGWQPGPAPGAGSDKECLADIPPGGVAPARSGVDLVRYRLYPT